MRLNDLVMTRKIQKLLAIDYDKKLTYLGGTTGTSKSVILFCWLVQKVLYTGRPGFFCIESSNKFYQQFVGDPNSIFHAWKEVGFIEYKDSSMGGQKIIVKSPKYGNVEIFIANYSNKSSWSRIVGTSFPYFAVDEGNLANKKMLDEITLRIYRNNGQAMINSNGDVPTNDLYEIVDRCTPDPEFAELMPKVERDYFKSEKDDWAAIHFNKEHDLAYMEEEQKQQLLSAFDPSSFLYKTKVLGIRGAAEGIIFNEQHIRQATRAIEPWMLNGIEVNSVGVDTSYSSKTKDLHTIVPITITRDGYLVIHNSWSHNNKEAGRKILADDLAREIYKACMKVNTNYAFIDNSDVNLIGTTDRMFPMIKATPSYKAFGIKDRIELLHTLLKNGKVIIEKGNDKLINEWINTTYSNKPSEAGKWADGGTHFLDALCYAFIPWRHVLQKNVNTIRKRGNN